MLHNGANRNNKNIASVRVCDNAHVLNFTVISYRVLDVDH